MNTLVLPGIFFWGRELAGAVEGIENGVEGGF